MNPLLPALLVPYTLAVALWGHRVSWQDAEPDWFLPILLFLAPRSRDPHFVVQAFLLGLCADLAGGQAWAVSAAAFSAIFLAIRKTAQLVPWTSLPVLLGAVGSGVYAVAGLERLGALAPLDWGAVHRRALLSAGLALAIAAVAGLHARRWRPWRRSPGATGFSDG